MKIKDFRLLLGAGAVHNARMIREPMGAGWLVEIEATVDGARQWIALEAKRGNVRAFASLDTAATALSSIGINNASLAM